MKMLITQVTRTFIYFAVFFTFCFGTESKIIKANCRCSDVQLCDPIKNTTRKEIFVFSLSNHKEIWSKYDWTKVTTVVMFGYINTDLMCLAHKHGARAVSLANFPKSQFTNSSARSEWVYKQVQSVQENFLDGVNIDFESAIYLNETAFKEGYSLLIKELYTALKKENPVYQLTVDVAWSPTGIDQRYYDYKAIAMATDFVFVMAYDEQSQIRGPCVAGPNSALWRGVEGIKKFLDLGIPSNKLVFGVPWYGYMYECLNLTADDVCYIKHVPFRGVNCSDAAGRQINYSSMRSFLKYSPEGVKWNTVSETPYFNFKNSSKTYQMQFDNPASLKIKFKTLQQYDLRGYGMWNADAVKYLDNSTDAVKDREEMWGSFPLF